MRDGYIGSGADEPDQREVCAALAILAGYFPEEDRDRVRRRIAEAIEEEFRLSGLAPPEGMI